MKPDRMRRVDEAIRKVLGDAIQRELKDPRVGFATVTGVRTSSDLSHAQVLISVLDLGPDSAGAPDAPAHTPEDTIAGLRSAVGFLQRRVGEELGLKNTPVLRFELDETVDRALRIQELLNHPPLPPVETPDGDDEVADVEDEPEQHVPPAAQDDAPR